MWIVDAMNAGAEKAGSGAPGTRIRTWHMEDMNLPAGHLDRRLPDSFRCLPGTSRSMSTITAGQIAGMSRASALDFSFFCLHAYNGGSNLLRTCLKSVNGQRRKRHRRPRTSIPRLDCLAIGFRSLIHRRLRRCGLVPGVGAQARLRTFRDLPHRRRRVGFGLGCALDRISIIDARIWKLICSERRCCLLYLNPFWGSSEGHVLAPACLWHHSAFPKS